MAGHKLFVITEFDCIWFFTFLEVSNYVVVIDLGVVHKKKNFATTVTRSVKMEKGGQKNVQNCVTSFMADPVYKTMKKLLSKSVLNAFKNLFL